MVTRRETRSQSERETSSTEETNYNDSLTNRKKQNQPTNSNSDSLILFNK